MREALPGWWIPEEPQAIVVSWETGRRCGVLTAMYDWHAYMLRLPVERPATIGEPDDPLYISLPLLEFRRTGANSCGLPVVEVRGCDGANENDLTPGYWPVVPPLPSPSFLLAIRKAQNDRALADIIRRLRKELALHR